MGLRSHKIILKSLREGEEVLHNCSGHPLMHLRLPLLFAMSVFLPFLALFFLSTGGGIDDVGARNVLWFLYSCYGLIMTTYFFVRCVNAQLSGCVITNQRLLRFGYKGLSQIIEREILPNKVEDFKVEKKGLLSLLSDTAYVYIFTANGEREVLRNVIQAREIQEAFSKMVKLHHQSNQGSSAGQKQKTGGEAAWIDDALGQSKGKVFDVEEQREEMIKDIGEVFKRKD
ncbi:MAG: hypothetical protein Q8P95_02095 [bacterium]|nr:hypothetical protein [bacterium]